MTREHKLALIVGFSLVLLVGVLIADHLSLARRQQMAPVGEKELAAARGPVPLPATLVSGPEISAGLEQLAAQGPVGGEAAPAEPPVPVLVPEEPVTMAQGDQPVVPPAEGVPEGPQGPAGPATSLASRPEASGPDAELAKLITGAGGSIEGNTIKLPPQVKLGTDGPKHEETARPEKPAAPGYRTYTVQKGDTYTKIAARQYGDGKLWRELVKFNGGDETARLGAVIKLPPRDALTGRPAATGPVKEPPKTAGTKAPGKKSEPSRPAAPSRTELALTYKVKQGDTLGEIAARTLGTSKRWREIAELNKLRDVDAIAAGTVLKLPPMRG